jgi:large subunit ribosomal protein L13
MKTTHVRAREAEERWYLYDASKHTLGRMAQQIAMQLMGKDRPAYTASELIGAHVVVIHAEKACVTGKKDEQKTYRHYSGYAGGLSHTPIASMREDHPADIVRLAVRRMLPKTTLGKRMLSRRKVYGGGEHPHRAQQPKLVEKLSR